MASERLNTGDRHTEGIKSEIIMVTDAPGWKHETDRHQTMWQQPRNLLFRGRTGVPYRRRRNCSDCSRWQGCTL